MEIFCVHGYFDRDLVKVVPTMHIGSARTVGAYEKRISQHHQALLADNPSTRILGPFYFKSREEADAKYLEQKKIEREMKHKFFAGISRTRPLSYKVADVS